MTYHLALLVFILLIAWRGRAQMLRAWQQRSLFRAGTCWGIAVMYVLSGASITFCAFGAAHIGLNPEAFAMQSIAVAGLVSMLLVRMIAGRLATPVFEINGISQADRKDINGLWMMFWMAGLAVGILPTLLPLAH
jgi:hypothetical protein